MKLLIRIFLFLAALALLLFLIGFLLPKHAHIERTTLIDAPIEEVYQLVNHLPSWEKWSPWYEMEPTVEMTYSTPASGTGSWYTWKGEETGAGKMTIVEATPNERIDAAMSFEGQGDAEADFIFEAISPTQTQVTWMFDSDNDSPVDRYFGLLMDNFLGPSYEKGLANLKREAEG